MKCVLILVSVQILLLHIGKARHGNGFIGRVLHLEDIQANEKTAAYRNIAFGNFNSDVYGLL
jgi:hypothetical protein